MADQALPPLDVASIIKALVHHDVDVVVIGGIAGIAHGNPRATFDLDTIPNPVAANLTRLARALVDLDATVFGVDAEHLDVDPTDPAQLATGANWTLVTRAGRLDLMFAAEGARDYPDLLADSIEVGEPAFRIVGLDDLIRMKVASGRPKDLDDVAALTLLSTTDNPPPPTTAAIRADTDE